MQETVTTFDFSSVFVITNFVDGHNEILSTPVSECHRSRCLSTDVIRNLDDIREARNSPSASLGKLAPNGVRLGIVRKLCYVEHLELDIPEVRSARSECERVPREAVTERSQVVRNKFERRACVTTRWVGGGLLFDLWTR